MSEKVTKVFEPLYAGLAPWDIGHPQAAFAELIHSKKIFGKVLDVGCGTGENALFFAQNGCSVVGVDASPTPVRRAKEKARQRGLGVTFMLYNALELKGIGEPFDAIVDCGLFHVFDNEDRQKYVQSLTAVSKKGTHLFLLCFSEDETREGPRRVSQADIRSAFEPQWCVKEIKATRFETHIHEGGALAWLAHLQLTDSGG